MKFPILTTEAHRGKTLEIDCERETISLIPDQGAVLGVVAWKSVIEWLQESAQRKGKKSLRRHARAPLAIRVTCTMPDDKKFDGMTASLSGGGMFIESTEPVPIGTALTLEFALLERPWVRFSAQAQVSWIRTKAERRLLAPGMGIQFTEIGREARARLLGLLNTLFRLRR